ncbi:YycH family regulatory protein [Lentilactobacillus sp. SPB1-3]|uniref:YycH family regulatory protein n=1 Tax=Lentilactobacillus terminaliae TaxID=3003483 RepID=A0ACD5DEU9_9LACO|nr:two-component system activity regulator YycH [Lentilactobacillus sp. SPB1-3]MCZ0976316.1 two-component system activity regulator YycH [Lentilactobacillus sp. SPB1-3]
MRFSKFLLPTGLVIAIAISLGLSVVLWTNPANYRSKEDNTQNSQSEILVKPKRTIFAPTQAIVNEKDGAHNILINQSVNMISEINQQMKGYRRARMRTIVSNDQKKYYQTIRRPDSILLNYASPVMISTVNSIVNDRFSRLDDHMVNRIILPLNDDSKIYLLNDSNFTVYQVNVKKHSLNGLNKVLKIKSSKFPVSIKNLNGAPTMYVDQPIKMQPYRYLLDRQSPDYFVGRLLNDSNSTNVSLKRRGSELIYSNQGTKRLVFNTKTRNAVYSDYSVNDVANNLKSMIDDSYRQLLKIGLPMDNLRFYGYNDDNSQVTFRSFVEGFPIFREDGSGEVSIDTVNTSLQRFKFLLDTPQVPIPSKSGYVALPTTTTVLNRLKNYGYKTNKIYKVRLGYRWEQSSKRTTLINLVPDWFVLYGNKWHSYNDMLNK